MILHDYAPHFERQRYELSTAGWFWLAYMCGITSALVYVLVVGYREQIMQAIIP